MSTQDRHHHRVWRSSYSLRCAAAAGPWFPPGPYMSSSEQSRSCWYLRSSPLAPDLLPRLWPEFLLVSELMPARFLLALTPAPAVSSIHRSTRVRPITTRTSNICLPDALVPPLEAYSREVDGSLSRKDSCSVIFSRA